MQSDHPSSLATAFARRDLLKGGAALAGGLAAGGVLAGCGRSSGGGQAAGPGQIPEALKPLAEAARKDGKLVLYTGEEESIVANLGKAFQAWSGVSLEYQRINSSEIATRFSAEAHAGKTVADVILTGDQQVFQMFSQKGWLAKLDASAVPALADWPKDYQDAYAAVMSIIPQAIAINTQLVSSPPADWNFLISPALKGGLISVDLKRVNLIAFAAWDMMLRTYGEDFLRKIGQQQMRVFDSGPSAVQQLASGGGKAYFPCSTTIAASMSAQGAPVTAVLPKNAPYTGVMTQVALSANAPHRGAGRLFAQFLMMPEGQAILNKVASSPVNAPGAPPLPPGFVKPDYVSTTANRAKIAQLLGM